MNAAGLALIKQFEGLHLNSYPDPKTGGEPWTIGWGATGPGIGPGMAWSRAKCDERLEADVKKYEAMVLSAVLVPLTENQLAALTSLVFNVGPGRQDVGQRAGRDGILALRNGKPSTLLRKLNAGDYDGAADAFLAWVSPGSAVEKGLRRRRVAERELFLKR